MAALLAYPVAVFTPQAIILRGTTSNVALLPRNFQQLEPRSVLIFLALEGEVTERLYFETASRLVEAETEKTWRVEVGATPLGSGLSSPRHVLNRAKEFYALHPYSDPNRIWLIMDADRQHMDVLKAGLHAEILALGFRPGISNPCFELWLWLHYHDVDLSLTSAEPLKKALAFDWSAWQTSASADEIRDAVQRAEALPGSGAVPFRVNPGTQVSALFRYLGLA